MLNRALELIENEGSLKDAESLIRDVIKLAPQAGQRGLEATRFTQVKTMIVMVFFRYWGPG